VPQRRRMCKRIAANKLKCGQGNHGYDDGELEEIYDSALIICQKGLCQEADDEDGGIVH
jgi:hypothetical protein